MAHAKAPFEQGNHCGRNVYGTVDGQRVDIGRMDRVEDAEFLVKAGNAYGQPCPFDEELRAGFRQSECRRRIAAVVADHHRDQLARHQEHVPAAAVSAAMVAVLAALGGATEPDQLGIAGRPDVVDQIQAITALASRSYALDATTREGGQRD